MIVGSIWFRFSCIGFGFESLELCGNINSFFSSSTYTIQLEVHRFTEVKNERDSVLLIQIRTSQRQGDILILLKHNLGRYI